MSDEQQICMRTSIEDQHSTVRLWGWTENGVELARAEKEPGYGADGSKSNLDPYMQGVAHRNSAYSQLQFSKLHNSSTFALVFRSLPLISFSFCSSRCLALV